MLPRIVTSGTISVTNGSRVAAGTGTSWSTLLDRGALVFAGGEARPGVVSSRQVRSTDSDIEDADPGTFVTDSGFWFAEEWAGATAAGAAYIAVVFGGAAELNEALARVLTEMSRLALVGGGTAVPDAAAGREKELYIQIAGDGVTVVIWQKRAGTWRIIDPVVLIAGRGPWVGDPAAKTALAIAAGEVAIDFETGALPSAGEPVRHFALTVDGDAEVQLPDNVAAGSILDILFTIDGGPHDVTFAVGYAEGAADLLRSADGARTRLRCTVTAETAGTATAVAVAAVAFAGGEAVEDRGFLYLSNADQNTAEPQLDAGEAISTDAWTWLPMVDGAPGSSDVIGTSASSVAIGTGAKSFTVVESDRGWAVGARLRISSDAAPAADWMEGAITAYAGAALTVSVDVIGGAGTHADWTINLAGARGAAGADGADGTDPGILLTWDDGNADADPGAGKIRADNDDLSAAAFLYVSKTNRAGDDIAAFLAGLEDSTNPSRKGGITLTRSGGNAQATFDFGALTDAAGYVKLAVSGHSGATGFLAADAVSFQFARDGDKGADGAGSVDSVNGATGAVVLDAGDIGFAPAGSIVATDVQAAIEELDAEKADAAAVIAALAGKQDSDADLAALAGVSATGLIARTGAGTAAARTITGSGGMTVANGDGVAGAPDISLTAPTAFASINTGSIGGWRNLLINPDGRLNQRALASNADNTYGHDRWLALTQTGTIAVSAVSDAENGTPKMWRLTQSQASAQRMGYAQWVEAANCKHLRGKNVTLSGRIKFSLNAAVRYAIFEWTGTADTLSTGRDPVNDWTSATYTGGNFFKSTTFNVLAVGSITPAAATLTDLTALTAMVGSSANNLGIMIWTEGTAAQNATLDGTLQLEVGSAASLREFRPVATELMLCQRYFQFIDGFTGGWPTSATTLTASGHFPVEMRTSPTAAINNGTNSALRYQVATYNISAIAGNGLNPTGGYVDLITASAAVGALGALISSAISADAEL